MIVLRFLPKISKFPRDPRDPRDCVHDQSTLADIKQYIEGRMHEEGEEEGDKQAIRCLKSSNANCASSFYLSRKENAPLLRLTFIEHHAPLLSLNRITVLNSIRKYSVK